MADAWRALGGRRRTLARLVYARDQADPDYRCPGAPGRPCGRPIDWALPYRDPDTEQVNVWSKSVDHRVELQDGGALLDPDNCWTAHLGCNASKGASRRHERYAQRRQAARPDPSAYISVDVSML